MFKSLNSQIHKSPTPQKNRQILRPLKSQDPQIFTIKNSQITKPSTSVNQQIASYQILKILKKYQILRIPKPFQIFIFSKHHILNSLNPQSPQNSQIKSSNPRNTTSSKSVNIQMFKSPNP